jgi:hypothetical protein
VVTGVRWGPLRVIVPRGKRCEGEKGTTAAWRHGMVMGAGFTWPRWGKELGGGGPAPTCGRRPGWQWTKADGCRQAAWPWCTVGASAPGQGKQALMHGPPRLSAGQQHQFKKFQTNSIRFKLFQTNLN